MLTPLPGYTQEYIVDDYSLPVIAASLQSRFRGSLIQDLFETFPIIEDRNSMFGEIPDIGEWFAAAGINKPSIVRRITCSNGDTATAAGLAGAGVLFARTAFCAQAIADGRLVAPFDLVVQSNVWVVMSYRQTILRDRRVLNFVEWIRAEAREHEEMQKRILAGKRIAKPWEQ